MATEAITPLKAGAAIGIISATIVSPVNARKYKRGRMTKREAVLDTAAESAGMGLAAGRGCFASNAARASVFVASTSALIPNCVRFSCNSRRKGDVGLQYKETHQARRK